MPHNQVFELVLRQLSEGDRPVNIVHMTINNLHFLIHGEVCTTFTNKSALTGSAATFVFTPNILRNAFPNTVNNILILSDSMASLERSHEKRRDTKLLFLFAGTRRCG